MRQTARYLLLILLASIPAIAHSAEPPHGPLVIVGGGLLANNSQVHQRMIDDAGGLARARFAVFPTASLTELDAQEFVDRMVSRGLPAERVQIIHLTVDNAKRVAEDPALVKQVLDCTGIYFAGGDQTRIVRALERDDGTATEMLKAILAVWSRGGVIAGSSAGAAVQSARMISVSGQTDEMLDEGMDALDFGLLDQPDQPLRRGLLLSHGLQLFHGGIIDQHFNQRRGRLGRLSRATIEGKVRFGFGIDENTALAVAPDGTFEVLGKGCVTIVDAQNAKCQDGPLGCRMSGLLLSCLQNGDRFDPHTGVATLHKDKKPIVAGAEENNGNYLIPDIGGLEATMHALFTGLADNTSRKQVGVTLKYHEPYGHGYRFTFTKTDSAKSHAGYVNGDFNYAILNVALEIEPITITLQPSQAGQPVDLPDGPSRKALQGLAFRGLLTADEARRLRPTDPITRAELASAIARTVYLAPARFNPPRFTDVPSTLPEAHEIACVVANRLMDANERGEFRPAAKITRQEGAVLLAQLAEQYRAQCLSTKKVALADAADISPDKIEVVYAALNFGLLEAPQDRFLPAAPLTREQAAVAIYKIIGFSW